MKRHNTDSKYRITLPSGLTKDGKLVDAFRANVAGKTQMIWMFLPDGWDEGMEIPCDPSELVPLH